MTEWHVVIGGETFGPVSHYFVRGKIKDGAITADTLVRKSDSPNWEAACKFFPEAKLPPPKQAQFAAAQMPHGANQQKPGHVSTLSGCITIVVVGALIVAFVFFQSDSGCCSHTIDSSVAPAAPKPEHDKLSAWGICQQFVNQKLKSPGSADYGWQQSHDKQVTDLGEGKYRCVGWVDSQNSYGALLRNNFVVAVQYEANGEWLLVEGPVFSGN